MAFTLQTLATIGGVPIDAPTIYSYKTSDSLTAVTTTGYFAAKQHEFEEGDLIFSFNSPDHAMLEVLADTSSAKIVDISQSDRQTFVETAIDYTQLPGDDVIYVTATAEITLIDPTTAHKPLTIRSISGTTTITPSSGTVETTTLTVGQSITQGPRASGFFNL